MAYYYSRKTEEIEKGDVEYKWLIMGIILGAAAIGLYLLLRKREPITTQPPTPSFNYSVSAQTMPYTKNYDQNAPIKFSTTIKNNTSNDASFPLWAEAGKYGQYYSNPTNGAFIDVPAGEEKTADWFLVVPESPDSPLLPNNYKVSIGDPYGVKDPSRKVFAEKSGVLSWSTQT